MDHDWQRVRKIFDEALCEPAWRRQEFLVAACGGDAQLKAEVESLLSSYEDAERFLESPAVVEIVDNLAKSRLSDGQTLGNYQIKKLLGSGGMGEVYLARDSRLHRNVAIKVLRENLLPDQHANRQLLREARAAAVLEHPNICQIYEISEIPEYSFIIMQYVVGTTLAERLATQRLSVPQALDIGIQIADGLAEAHANGVIHRDIKPGNIIVNDKDQVKILDFGLAKFVETETAEETMHRLNTSGAILGTVPFMSPEQLRGRAVDERTDIFSFGSLFYEMVTGRQAFARESSAETISAILNDDPSWDDIPKRLRPIIERCLTKNADERFRSATELAEELRSITAAGDADGYSATDDTSPAGHLTDPGAPHSRRQYYFWQSSGDESSNSAASGLAISKSAARLLPFLRSHALQVSGIAVLFLVLGFTAVWWSGSRRSSDDNFASLRPVRLVSWKTGGVTNSTDFRLSHDGKMVAYSSSQRGGNEVIYIKQTSDGAEFQVTKSDSVNVSPLWSPDDQQIAFVSLRDGQLGIYVGPTLGGTIVALRNGETANIALRHWSGDGSAIFYEQLGNLYRLDVSTREVAKVTVLPDSPTGNDRFFSFSPDESKVVFCDTREGRRDVWTMVLRDGAETRVTNDDDVELRPLWHHDGKRILYNIFRNDFAQINLTEASGEMAPIQVTRGEGHYVLVDMSPDGDRVYYGSAEKKSDISKVDLETRRVTEVAAEDEVELLADPAPDGESVLYHINSSPNPTRRIYESVIAIKNDMGGPSQLAVRGFDARWLPDSQNLSILRPSATTKGEYEAWIVDTITGAERKLVEGHVTPPSISPMPISRVDVSVLDFSPDGRLCVFLDPRKPQNVHVGEHATGRYRRITDNSNEQVRFFSPIFSRDGTEIAILANETFADKQRSPVWYVALAGNSPSPRIVHSTTDSLRLIGWDASGEVLVAIVQGPIGGKPIDAEVIAMSPEGRSRKVASISSVYVRSMTLSPDGKTIAFVARRDELDDLWTVPLAGGAPSQITFNDSTRLFLVNPVFSADGKAIYFDKQEEVNAISMFENFE